MVTEVQASLHNSKIVLAVHFRSQDELLLKNTKKGEKPHQFGIKQVVNVAPCLERKPILIFVRSWREGSSKHEYGKSDRTHTSPSTFMDDLKALASYRWVHFWSLVICNACWDTHSEWSICPIFESQLVSHTFDWTNTRQKTRQELAVQIACSQMWLVLQNAIDRPGKLVIIAFNHFVQSSNQQSGVFYSRGFHFINFDVS